jgi:hypothetical protein
LIYCSKRIPGSSLLPNFVLLRIKPTAATFAELQQFADGLVCLTGDEDGPLADVLRRGGKEQARKGIFSTTLRI